jgi:hypothetical protein
MGRSSLGCFDEPLIGGGHRAFAGFGGTEPEAVAHFDPTKTKPAQNSRENRSVVFSEFEVDGVASIAQRALKNLYSLAACNPLRLQIDSPEARKGSPLLLAAKLWFADDALILPSEYFKFKAGKLDQRIG